MRSAGLHIEAPAAATGGVVGGGGGGGLGAGLSLARHIALTEGPAGFARGLLPRMLLLAPVSSLTIAFYAVVQSMAQAAPATTKAPGAAMAKGGK